MSETAQNTTVTAAQTPQTVEGVAAANDQANAAPEAVAAQAQPVPHEPAAADPTPVAKPKKLGIQLSEASYTSAPTPVVVPNGDGELTLYVHELGHMEIEEMFAKAHASGGVKAPLPMIIAESVQDADGNKFTLDEVMRLKRSVSKPLLDAVIQVNGLKEKN